VRTNKKSTLMLTCCAVSTLSSASTRWGNDKVYEMGTIVGGYMNGQLAEWCMETGKICARIGTHENAVSSIILKGNTMYSASWDSTCRIWEWCESSKQWLQKIILQVHVEGETRNPVARIAMVSPTKLLCGTWDGKVRLLDVGQKKECLKAFEVFRHSAVRCMTWDYATEKTTKGANDDEPRDIIIYCGTEDRFLASWFVPVKEDKEATRRLHWKAHNGEITALSMGTIGASTMLISGSEDCLVRVWDPSNAYMSDEFRAHEGAVLCFVVTPTLLYCGSRDTTIRSFALEDMTFRMRERTLMRMEDLRAQKIHLFQKLTQTKPNLKKFRKGKNKSKGKKRR